MGPILGLGLVVVFVVLNGFFVAAEFALVKVRDTQLLPLERKGDRGAKLAREVIERLESYLNACQLGITLSSLALGWVGEPAIARQIEPLLLAVGISSQAVVHSTAFAVAFTVMSILHILFGELVPKSIGIRQAVRTARFSARPLMLFRYTFIWFLAFMDLLSNWVLRAMRMPPLQHAEGTLSAEEIRLLIESSGQEIDERKRELLVRVLRAADRQVSLAMVPRRDVVFLNRDASLEETRERVRRHEYSRFPVVEDGDLDKIIGYVHVRDLFFGTEQAADLESKLRTPLYTPMTANISGLLDKMSGERVHMAVVVDEYGGTSGLVTLEDLLEELVGEIQDEFDEETAALVELPDGSVRMAGKMALVDAAAHLGVEIGADVEDRTLGGYATDVLGRIPVAGDEVPLGDRVMKIAAVQRRRVVQVLVKPPMPPSEQD